MLTIVFRAQYVNQQQYVTVTDIAAVDSRIFLVCKLQSFGIISISHNIWFRSWVDAEQTTNHYLTRAAAHSDVSSSPSQTVTGLDSIIEGDFGIFHVIMSSLEWY